MGDAPQHTAEPNDAEVVAVQRWRRSVVRLWIGTMVTAIVVWTLLAVTAVPWLVEAAAGALLVILTVVSVWNMRRGTCPRCGAAIRFQPRIELPRACPHCSAPFAPAP